MMRCASRSRGETTAAQNAATLRTKALRIEPLRTITLRMSLWVSLIATLLFASHTGGPEARAEPVSRRADFLNQYCIDCHNQDDKAGGLVLAGVPTNRISARPDVWEDVVRKLASGEMPPEGSTRPDKAASDSFRTGLIKELDQAARQHPYAGRTVIRRLNRTEYANAIRDLLAIELSLTEQLPPDGMAAGFDNIGDALSMSPLLLEQYLKVARRVSQLAVGVSDPSPLVETFPATETQSQWQKGMPFGTRGGIRVQHYFPYDAEYELRAFLQKQSLTPTEGVRFFRTRVSVKAGQRVVVVTFPDEFAEREGPVLDVSGPGGKALGGPLDLLGTANRPTLDFRIDGRRVKLFEIGGMSAGEAAFDGLPGPPILGRIEIAGPYNVTGVSETPSRERIFICRPDNAKQEPECAEKILSAVVRRAFRRPVTTQDIQPYLATFAAAREQGSFESAIAAALRDVLLAPDFLFRLEFDRSDAAHGTAHPVSDFELATRLSFFLWSSIPDDELLEVAASGKLRDPAVLDRQVRHMLADPRARALDDNFVEQWLGLRRLAAFRPNPRAFREFDQALRAAFRQETRLFVRSVIRENRSVLDLVGADYTYLNERLARNYGIDNITGPGFRRVRLKDNQQRGGLLGHGSILMVTSHSAKTSPVLRGTWILDNLLNSPPPPPPAQVPPLDESPVDGRQLTTREQVERHRADPSCASCHAKMDPLGFALENFDVIGRWRIKDEGGVIDASGSLPNGESFSGPAGLKNLLLNNPERFVGATVERLMTYALGRELDARDQPAVRKILRSTKADGYRFVDVISAIVKSVPFQMRQTPNH